MTRFILHVLSLAPSPSTPSKSPSFEYLHVQYTACSIVTCAIPHAHAFDGQTYLFERMKKKNEADVVFRIFFFDFVDGGGRFGVRIYTHTARGEQ